MSENDSLRTGNGERDKFHVLCKDSSNTANLHGGVFCPYFVRSTSVLCPLSKRKTKGGGDASLSNIMKPLFNSGGGFPPPIGLISSIIYIYK